MDRKRFIVVLDNEQSQQQESFLESWAVVCFAEQQEAPQIYGASPDLVGIECIARIAGYARRFPEVRMIVQDRPSGHEHESEAARIRSLIADYEKEQIDLNASFRMLSSLALQVQMAEYMQGDCDFDSDTYNVFRLCGDLGITRSELYEIILADTSNLWQDEFVAIEDEQVRDKIRWMLMIWHEVFCQLGDSKKARIWMQCSNALYGYSVSPSYLIANDRMFEAYCLALALDESACA